MRKNFTPSAAVSSFNSLVESWDAFTGGNLDRASVPELYADMLRRNAPRMAARFKASALAVGYAFPVMPGRGEIVPPGETPIVEAPLDGTKPKP